LKLLTVLACAFLILPAPVRAAAAAVDRAESYRQLAFGVKMAQNGSWHEAAFRFGKAVTADPGNAFAQNDLGVALESVGQFEQALAAYEKALLLESGNPKMRENRDRLKAYLATRATPRTGAAAMANAPPVPAATPAPSQPAAAEPQPPAADPNGAASPGGGGRP